MIVDVVIPALDEERALPGVLADLAQSGTVRQLLVVDNGSRDRTAQVAAAAGATVLSEPRRGYGAACLRALAYLRARAQPPDVVVFSDGDGSDDAGALPELLQAIARGADLVIGARTGALLPHQKAGNRVATALIRLLYGHQYADLGPFRAIRWPALCALGMRDQGYGWTVEMQLRALRMGLKVCEVPVRARPRVAGRSKVSGTLRGTAFASGRILYTILRYATAR